MSDISIKFTSKCVNDARIINYWLLMIYLYSDVRLSSDGSNDYTKVFLIKLILFFIT